MNPWMAKCCRPDMQDKLYFDMALDGIGLVPTEWHINTPMDKFGTHITCYTNSYYIGRAKAMKQYKTFSNDLPTDIPKAD
jgi:hypothetical protein